MTARPVAFLDRDGTLNENVGYLADPNGIRLIPGAGDAVCRLNRAGVAVVVVTNQSAIARGLATVSEVARVNDALVAAIAREGGHVDGVYVCPHHPDVGEPCRCRKPGTELLARAVRELSLDWRRAAIVGDNASDVEAGRRVGITAVLVETGHGRAVREAGWDEAADPDAVVGDIGDAVAWLLSSGSFDVVATD